MKYIGNAFSLQMLNLDGPKEVHICPVSAADIPSDCHSIIGHQDTASVVADMLGFPVPFNRESIRMTSEDELFVAQITGGRLPEGATSLPEGFHLEFFKVTVGG